MAGRAADVAAVSALAVLLTLALAAPVLRKPSERIFGMEIVGRQHDPFTVMAQFGRPITLNQYSQPLTDVTGALLARVAGPVAAYNWLVLLSFPLSAAAAYLLARHLALSRFGATFAAIAFAFSPFHLAQAAYHPHIAQTQWIPLYLLALWRCLDDASPLAVVGLGAAAIAVTLSNFYGGLIAAVITPVAVAAYWLGPRRGGARSIRGLGITVAALAAIAGAGVAYAWYAARAVVLDRAAFAFPRADLFRYSAKWWSYLIPPIEHPLFGGAALQFWATARIGAGLLEQQVYLGWSVIALGLVAGIAWLIRRRHPASLSRVPALVIVAVTALVCSLSPERTIGAFRFLRPSALLYDVAPMFRAYARFGVVVQLMAALLAGIGVDWLRRTAAAPARLACVALVVLAAGDYAVLPSALWRDVLPTAAHRWVMQQTGPIRVLDCTPLTPESESIQWLTHGRVDLLNESISDCIEPNLPEKLAADGYTDLLVRRHTDEGRSFAERPVPAGLRLAAHFDNEDVFAVTAAVPAIYTEAMTQFSSREHDAVWTWRWMGTDAAWIIVNTGDRPINADLSLELLAFPAPRRMNVLLDGRQVQSLDVEASRHLYVLGPFTVPPGRHQLMFHPLEAPAVADDVIHNGDRRPLSIAFGTWHWTVRQAHP